MSKNISVSYANKVHITLHCPGRVCKRMGTIFVDKSSKDSRKQTHEAIADWLDKYDKLDPDPLQKGLAIAPEGWYENGKMLLPFKTGAFKPGRPVQPAVIEWDKSFNPTVTTWGGNISWFWVHILTLAQPWVNVTVRNLPVYYPSEGKVKNG